MRVLTSSLTKLCPDFFVHVLASPLTRPYPDFMNVLAAPLMRLCLGFYACLRFLPAMTALAEPTEWRRACECSVEQ